MTPASAGRIVAIGTIACCVAATTAGCTFQGLNSLPLPGAVGNSSSAQTFHAEIANIGTLDRNSPVMLDNVVVGSVGEMTFDRWHIDVEFSVRPDVAIPANAAATVGQTSLLGSMHLAVDAPAGEAPRGRLSPGSTLRLNTTSTYPSTEQTLLALSSVVNGGGLGQIGDVVHSMNDIFNGHQDQIRDLILRLNNLVGILDTQRDNMLGTVRAVNRLAGTLAAQGYRLRVPYGTLLCVSDKPLHGEIKLPGAANAFYDRAVGEHLLIGLAAIDLLREDREGLHSRKLRSFDEPPFR